MAKKKLRGFGSSGNDGRVTFVSPTCLPANDDRSLWPLDYAIQRTRERGYTDVRFAPFTHVTSVSIREGREWFLVVRDDATSAEVAAMLQLACEKG